MSSSSLFRRIASGVLSVATALVVCAASGQAQTNNVVISQVYGGGGNSGATYTNDFIEIFNPSASTLTLTNYSIQYASAAGTSWQVTPLSASPVTLQPGQYFLIQEAVGAGGTTALPTPDATGTIPLSATAGKIALVSSLSPLSGACPTSATTLVDLVGFGTANCSLGSPVTGVSNTMAAIRTPSCMNTPNNSVDFKAMAPAPRNEQTTTAACGGFATLTATATATPSTAYTNTAVLLTAQVTPASTPASTGITVTADLSSIGGSSTQVLYDDGSNGDVTKGDNIFSYSTTVTSVGVYSLPVVAMDAQARTAKASIALTTQTPPTETTIRTIQAQKPSAFVGQVVTTSGIVVGVRSNGFYLEAKDADVNPVTPEGIFVYTSSTMPSYIAVGAGVQVTGTVSTYPAASTTLTPSTELGGTNTAPLAFTLQSTNNPLPTPVPITAAMDSPSGGVYQFAKYEGMRVSIGSVTTTSGTDATLTEQTETNVSNGRFYGVVTGVARPFREPGISVTDLLYTNSATVPPAVPRWDSNPELIYFDSIALGGPAINLTSNTTLTNVVGVVDFSFGDTELLLDATTRPTVSGLMTAQPVPAAAANEFSVASFNMERFYNDVTDQDNPGSSVVTVTTAAYQRRLAKVSLAIRNVLNFPDIIGAQELENINVLTDVANKVSADAQSAGQVDPVYVPYLFLATDPSGINTGFLVKSTKVTTVKAEQMGLTTTFTNAGGAQASLNDRTPLVLHAGIKRAGGADYPVTVIDVHQRSLINVDDPTSTGQTVRLKREAQAEYLANLIQGYQAAGEHVITVGDYNAFEFSDGFVDSLGVIKGNPVPASQVVTPPASGLASPTLVDLVTLLPPEQRQSYVETGSAQDLDHVVVTPELVPTETRLVFAHMDSDFPLVYLNDAARPERVSDHDPAVAYFSVPSAVVSGTVQLVTRATLTKVSGGYQATVTITNNGTGTAQNVQLTGAVLGSASGSPLPQVFGNIAPNGGSASAIVTFPASAGNSGAATAEKYSGSYTTGNFSTSIRATLP
jgi:hypothetical protein